MLNELIYDTFHEYANNHYRVEINWPGQVGFSRSTSHPLAPALKEGIPEIKDACRFVYLEKWFDIGFKAALEQAEKEFVE